MAAARPDHIAVILWYLVAGATICGMATMWDKCRGWGRGAAWVCAVVALPFLGTAWTLALYGTPVRPSIVHGLAGVGAYAMLGAMVLGIASTQSTKRRSIRGYVSAAVFVMLLLPSCCLFVGLGGPPGEIVQFQWDHAADANARAVGQAIERYVDQRGQLPARLDDLVREGFVPVQATRDPATGKPFRFLPHGVQQGHDVLVCFTEPVAERDGGVGVYEGGYIESMSRQDLDGLLVRLSSDGGTITRPTSAPSTAPGG